MANGNGRNLTGSAREHFNNGDIPAALAASSEQHARTQVRKIIYDPRILVEQTPFWVAEYKKIEPNILQMWEQRVREFAGSAAIMLQKHLAGVQSIDPDVKISLKFSGRGTIYLALCPLCNKDNVMLGIIPLAEFRPRTFTDRIFSKHQCNHRLPLPNGFWQFLKNIDSLLGSA